MSQVLTIGYLEGLVIYSRLTAFRGFMNIFNDHFAFRVLNCCDLQYFMTSFCFSEAIYSRAQGVGCKRFSEACVHTLENMTPILLFTLSWLGESFPPSAGKWAKPISPWVPMCQWKISCYDD